MFGLKASGCTLLVLALYCCWLTRSVESFAYELTFSVEPGQVECFYQPVSQSSGALEIDFQVLEGAGMDITLSIRGPNRQQIELDHRKQMGSHQIMIKEPGDYELCWDNTFSHMTAKMVFFEIYAEFDDTSFPSALKQAQQTAIEETAEEIMDTTVDHIKTALTTVQRNTEKCRNLQALIVSFMRRDRNVAEANYTRVNLFSGGYLFAMITVSLVQVLMIRNLFTVSSTHDMKVPT